MANIALPDRRADGFGRSWSCSSRPKENTASLHLPTPSPRDPVKVASPSSSAGAEICMALFGAREKSTQPLWFQSSSNPITDGRVAGRVEEPDPVRVDFVLFLISLYDLRDLVAKTVHLLPLVRAGDVHHEAERVLTGWGVEAHSSHRRTGLMSHFGQVSCHRSGRRARRSGRFRGASRRKSDVASPRLYWYVATPTVTRDELTRCRAVLACSLRL